MLLQHRKVANGLSIAPIISTRLAMMTVSR